MGILFCLTCTESLHNLLNHHTLKFHWTGKPDVKLFLNFSDYPFNSPGYIKQKAGHAFCFFWLAFSYKSIFRKQYTVFFCAVSYAFITEIAQLFFSRTGCLLDVGYDAAGIIMFIAVYRTFHWRGRLRSGLRFDTYY